MKFNSCISLIGCLLFISCARQVKEIYQEEGRREFNGAQLYYRIIGEGEPVLMVHGGPGLNHQYMFSHFKDLATDHRLIFYDQRACGRSSRDLDSSDISLDLFVNDIKGIQDSFRIDKINILAHSWGGLLAMKYAIRYPGSVKSLILVSSVSASRDEDGDISRELSERFTREDSMDRIRIVQSESFAKAESVAIEALMKLSFRHQFYDRNFMDSLNFHLEEDFVKTNNLLQYLGKDLMNYNFYNELNSIQARTMLIYGEIDPMSKYSGIKLEEHIPGARLEIIDHCGHFPFIEKREEFNEMIRDFLAD